MTFHRLSMLALTLFTALFIERWWHLEGSPASPFARCVFVGVFALYLIVIPYLVSGVRMLPDIVYKALTPCAGGLRRGKKVPAARIVLVILFIAGSWGLQGGILLPKLGMADPVISYDVAAMSALFIMALIGGTVFVDNLRIRSR